MLKAIHFFGFGHSTQAIAGVAAIFTVAALFYGCSKTVDAPEEDSSISTDVESSASENSHSSSSEIESSPRTAISDTGRYTTKDDVAEFICKYDKLPKNYISKSEGKSLYESTTGSTFIKWNFNPLQTIGFMIGGDIFNNFESDSENFHSSLPEGSYFEADVDYSGDNRGTNRLVYQSGMHHLLHCRPLRNIFAMDCNC